MSNDDYSFGSSPQSPPPPPSGYTPSPDFDSTPTASISSPGYASPSSSEGPTPPPPPQSSYSQSPYVTPQQGNSQGYPGYPGYYPAQPPAAPGKGMAVAALVLGSVALLFCWVPILNLFTGLLAIVGLVLGIIAIVQASKGRAGGQSLAIVGTILSGLSLLIGFVVGISFFAAVGEEVQRMEEDGFFTYEEEQWPGMDLDIYYEESL